MDIHLFIFTFNTLNVPLAAVGLAVSVPQPAPGLGHQGDRVPDVEGDGGAGRGGVTPDNQSEVSTGLHQSEVSTGLPPPITAHLEWPCSNTAAISSLVTGSGNLVQVVTGLGSTPTL